MSRRADSAFVVSTQTDARQRCSRHERHALRRYVQASEDAWFARPGPRVALQVVWDGYKYSEELGCVPDRLLLHRVLSSGA